MSTVVPGTVAQLYLTGLSCSTRHFHTNIDMNVPGLLRKELYTGPYLCVKCHYPVQQSCHILLNPKPFNNTTIITLTISQSTHQR